MGAVAQLLLTAFGEVAAFILKRWGFKVAMATSVLGAYTLCYASFLAAVAALLGMIPSFSWTPFALQFFPSRYAIAFVCTAFFGSIAVKKACTYFVKAFVNVAKIAS